MIYLVKIMTDKIQITMTIDQARIVMKAMDLYSRIMMGQFEIILEHFDWGDNAEKIYGRRREDQRHAENSLNIVKDYIYPNLRGAYYGITGEPCPKNATAIYDMFAQIRHVVDWHDHPNGEHAWTVSYAKPMHWLKEYPEIDVKVITEE